MSDDILVGRLKLVLNADDLGEKGERRFQEICVDANIVCNQATRDRLGWDFVLDFDFKESSASLDSRVAPLSCYVQVKTLHENSDSVRMRLSAAERLAKELKPTFVYIMKVNIDLNVIESYLIHILDAPLFRILKRLRKEHLAGHTKINRMTFSLSGKKDGERILTTGSALRAALEAACGFDLRAYNKEKEEQLRNLGFGPYACELTTTLHLQNYDELVDAFLGLKTDITASNVQRFETRFGIRLPIAEPSAGKFTIKPTAADRCTVTIRPGDLLPPLVFEGEAFSPGIPGIRKEKVKILIRTQLFDMMLDQFTLSLKADIQGKRYTPKIWRKYWQLALALAGTDSTIQIQSDKGFDLSFPATSKLCDFDPTLSDHWVGVFERISYLLEMAGVAAEPELSMEEISEHEGHIEYVSKLLMREPVDISPHFDTENPRSVEHIPEVDAVLANFIRLGPTVLGYYGVVYLVPEIRGEYIRWTYKNFVIKHVRVIRETKEAWNDFLKAAKKHTALTNVVSFEPA